MNIQINPRVLLVRESVKKIVPMLAGKKIRVTQQGMQARVEWDTRTLEIKKVNLPYIPDDASDAMLDAIQGFLDHEIGHCLFTDAKVVLKATQEKCHFLHNVIEDTFVERKMRERFPGSITNLESVRRFFLYEHIEKKRLENPHVDPINFLIVPIMRSWCGQDTFTDYMKDKWDLAKDFLTAAGPDMPAMVRAVNSSEDGLEVTRELVRRLKDKTPQPNPETGMGEPQFSNEPGDGEPQPGAGKGKGKDKGEPTPPENDDGLQQQQGGGEPEQSKDKPDGKDEAGKTGSEGKKGKKKPEPKQEPVPPADDAGDSGHKGSEKDDSSGKDKVSPDEPEQPDGSGGSDDDATGETPGEDAQGEGSDGSDAGEPDGDGGDDEGSGSDSGDGGDGETDGDDAEGEGSAGGADAPNPDGEGKGGPGSDTPPSRPFDGSDPEEPGDAEGSDGSSGSGNNEGEGEFDQAGEASPGDGVGADDAFFDRIEPDMIPDFDTDAAEALTNHAAKEFDDSDYLVFTTDEDVIEILPFSADEESVRLKTEAMCESVDHMVAPLQKDLERAVAARSQAHYTGGHRSGRLHSGSLHRLHFNDDRVFRRKEENVTKDVAVSLLIDDSGSMRGRNKLGLAVQTAYALSSVLDRLQINHEVLAFTTMDFPHAMQRQIEKEHAAHPVDYARLEAIYMPIIKPFDQRMNAEVRRRFAELSMGLKCDCNVDGESLQIAANRLLQQKQKRKIQMVLSDGMPAAMGDASKLNAHLKSVVLQLSRLPNFDVLGIGIMTDAVQEFYPKHVVLDKVEDLPTTVIGQIKSLLLK